MVDFEQGLLLLGVAVWWQVTGCWQQVFDALLGLAFALVAAGKVVFGYDGKLDGCFVPEETVVRVCLANQAGVEGGFRFTWAHADTGLFEDLIKFKQYRQRVVNLLDINHFNRLLHSFRSLSKPVRVLS